MRTWSLAALLFCWCGGAQDRPATALPVVELPEAGTTREDSGPAACLDAPQRVDGGYDAFETGKRLFQEKRYGEAAAVTRALAFDTHPASEYATTLYLSALMAAAKDRPQCQSQLVTDLPKLQTKHCAGPNAPRDCRVLARIDVDLQRYEVEMELQDGGAPDASVYLGMFAKYCRPPAMLETCDEILYNVAVVHVRANRMDKAREILAMMKDPKNGVAKSKLTTELECRLGPQHEQCDIRSRIEQDLQKLKNKP